MINVSSIRLLLLLLFIAACVANAETLIVKHASGEYSEYKDYTVLRAYEDGIVVSHSYGITKVPQSELPPSIAKRYAGDIKRQKEIYLKKQEERRRLARQGSVIKKTNSSSPFVTVLVTGKGINENEALEDAFRAAVRKVVGMYVVTQSALKNDNLEESVFINADAVVTQHKVLQRLEEDGLSIVQIEATVVRNHLLKYIEKSTSTQISSTDLGNLLNRRRALADAEQSLEYIFKNYAEELYHAERIGNFSVAANDDVNSDTVKLEMTYRVRFNQNGYKKIKERLQKLLSKIAFAQRNGSTDDYDKIVNGWRDPIVSKFNSSEASKSWPTGAKTIVFIDEYWKQQKMYRYHLYAVPNQIYEKIISLLSTFGVIVFDFQISSQTKPLKGCIELECYSFWKSSFADRDTLCFQNGMWITVPDYSRQFTLKHDFKKTWNFSEEQIRMLKRCSLKVYTGQLAKFIWYRYTKSYYDMRRLAEEGYLPAMIAMAEQFNEKSWYHIAALMGSRRVQQQLNWKNGGLGFEVMYTDRCFTVCSARKGSGIKRGMILKSINGSQECLDPQELSTLIGSLSVGESVSVEFTNGKTVKISPQPL